MISLREVISRLSAEFIFRPSRKSGTSREVCYCAAFFGGRDEVTSDYSYTHVDRRHDHPWYQETLFARLYLQRKKQRITGEGNRQVEVYHGTFWDPINFQNGSFFPAKCLTALGEHKSLKSRQFANNKTLATVTFGIKVCRLPSCCRRAVRHYCMTNLRRCRVEFNLQQACHFWQLLSLFFLSFFGGAIIIISLSQSRFPNAPIRRIRTPRERSCNQGSILATKRISWRQTHWDLQFFLTPQNSFLSFIPLLLKIFGAI